MEPTDRRFIRESASFKNSLSQYHLSDIFDSHFSGLLSSVSLNVQTVFINTMGWRDPPFTRSSIYKFNLDSRVIFLCPGYDNVAAQNEYIEWFFDGYDEEEEQNGGNLLPSGLDPKEASSLIDQRFVFWSTGESDIPWKEGLARIRKIHTAAGKFKLGKDESWTCNFSCCK